ncbi:MAG: HdeD family acid-resistance protein [Alphaproteobacteria bacterium]|jgi:uncharacterized membrane protein HdeD (DUF308 family)|nr:HdeD family acid-resistance protein [Rhodospirillaceae bacterium]MDG2482789.1 HdeD family acid-resistance protein [Alphaproteobacteria bacterium]MBT6202330.1 HdeD family acid-resistance protein [Rhodospirillaceae bacterium]MBT6511236.1 HdeD family acid-resistance protein [Rhodospirillaceae bacterium]MBT7613030.1 HdeD family acid-resistance protein [Rhodospirillaceae bacterium]
MNDQTNPTPQTMMATAGRALFWEGLALIVLGTIAIAVPAVFTLAIEALIGVLLLIGGIARLFRCIGAKDGGPRLWPVIAALVSIVAGVFLLANPVAGTITLTAIVIVLLLAEGAAKTVGAFALRPNRSWAWLLFNGLIDIALGALLWAGLPSTALWALGLMVGISLIMTGWTAIMLSSGVKRLGDAAGD